MIKQINPSGRMAAFMVSVSNELDDIVASVDKVLRAMAFT
jgi:hypothetical protein